MRLLVRDDPRQLDLAEKFNVKDAWISHVMLVEALLVLDTVYERSAEQIGAAVERLLMRSTASSARRPGLSDSASQRLSPPVCASPSLPYPRRRAALIEAFAH